ncbi:hypothetical protein GGI42DRAFT_230429 [Trichoderma sp. SZMC 28013]
MILVSASLLFLILSCDGSRCCQPEELQRPIRASNGQKQKQKRNKTKHPVDSPARLAVALRGVEQSCGLACHSLPTQLLLSICDAIIGSASTFSPAAFRRRPGIRRLSRVKPVPSTLYPLPSTLYPPT